MLKTLKVPKPNQKHSAVGADPICSVVKTQAVNSFSFSTMPPSYLKNLLSSSNPSAWNSGGCVFSVSFLITWLWWWATSILYASQRNWCFQGKLGFPWISTRMTPHLYAVVKSKGCVCITMALLQESYFMFVIVILSIMLPPNYSYQVPCRLPRWSSNEAILPIIFRRTGIVSSVQAFKGQCRDSTAPGGFQGSHMSHFS